MKKSRLVKDWRCGWRWHSTRALLALGLLPTLWAELPAEWRAEFPASGLRLMALLVMLAGLIGRVVQQPPAGKTR
ncbi:hypothetical protein [Pantoea sp. 1.19]|uniref:DUF7940 domain-containing protein n=1 Tax=Pantoea sp. 1.19 TaxID=1925589 RepID=UPI000948E66B|nr:hypothetical protein [Pantoea sp. 1.19]